MARAVRARAGARERTGAIIPLRITKLHGVRGLPSIAVDSLGPASQIIKLRTCDAQWVGRSRSAPIRKSVGLPVGPEGIAGAKNGNVTTDERRLNAVLWKGIGAGATLARAAFRVRSGQASASFGRFRTGSWSRPGGSGRPHPRSRCSRDPPQLRASLNVPSRLRTGSWSGTGVEGRRVPGRWACSGRDLSEA
jgi:hypothetical protein